MATGGIPVADKPEKKPGKIVEIPFSAIRKSIAMSQSSFRSCTSYRRFAVAELSQEICPYNEKHVIQTSKMESHLIQCRREYRKGLLKNGKERYLLSCKHNYKHQVDVPELLYHEARCLDRLVIPPYLLYLNPYFEAVGETVEENLEDVEIPDEELDKLYAGYYIDKFVGAELPAIEPIPVEDLNQPLDELLTLKELMDVEQSMAARSATGEKVPDQVELQTGLDTQKNIFRSAKGEGWNWATDVESTYEGGGYTEEELKEWRGDPNQPQPTFDYMHSTYNPQKPMLKYPPGLTKAARRNFVEWNTQWMKDILKSGKDIQSETEPEFPIMPADEPRAETFSDSASSIDSEQFDSTSSESRVEYFSTDSEPHSQSED